MAITWYGHELSGLPSYGLSDQGIVRRSYMLYRGRNPRAVRSEAKLIQPLSPPEIDALRRELVGVDTGFQSRRLRDEALKRGGLVEVMDESGTPQWEQP